MATSVVKTVRCGIAICKHGRAEVLHQLHGGVHGAIDFLVDRLGPHQVREQPYAGAVQPVNDQGKTRKLCGFCRCPNAVMGSSGSYPAITASMRAASATERVMGPASSCVLLMGRIPLRLTRPRVGRMPTKLVADAGDRVD